MEVILLPHEFSYFGQDFTSNYLVSHLHLVPVIAKDDRYNLEMFNINEINTIISRYPDSELDNQIIRKFSGKIKIISHVHLKFNFLNFNQKNILSDSLYRSDIILANCNMLCKEYRTHFPDLTIDFVNNGIDSNIFKVTSLEERALFKKNFNIPNEKFLLSYTGRFNLAKGFQILKRLCEYVSKSNKFFLVLQCIDIPKQRMNIEKLSKNYSNIKLILEQDIKAVRYSDISINTSLSETTSLVTLESLFSGVPVICTDITEFYDELIYEDIEFKYFYKVKMPKRILNFSESKEKLLLQDKEINEITAKFLNEISCFKVLKQYQREVLSYWFRDSKFESTVMLKNIKKIYGII